MEEHALTVLEQTRDGYRQKTVKNAFIMHFISQ